MNHAMKGRATVPKVMKLNLPIIIIIIVIITNSYSLYASSFMIPSSIQAVQRIRIARPPPPPLSSSSPTSRLLLGTAATTTLSFHSFPNRSILVANHHLLLPSSKVHTTTISSFPCRNTIATRSGHTFGMKQEGREEEDEEVCLSNSNSMDQPATSIHGSKINNNNNNNNNKINNNNNNDSLVVQSWKTRIDIAIAKSRSIRGSNYVQLSTVDGLEPRCRTVVFRGFMKGLAVPSSSPTTTSQNSNSSSSGSSSSTTSMSENYDFGDECVMKMITDARSSKVHEVLRQQNRREGLEKNDGEERMTTMMTEVQHHNTAEMVWWFPKSSEQFRVRGKLQFIGRDGPMKNDDIHQESNKKEADMIMKKFLIEQRKHQWGNLSDMAREQFYWENPGEPYDYGMTPAQRLAVPMGGRDDDGKVLPPPDTFLLMLLYPTRVDYLRLRDNYHQVDERVVHGDVGGASYRWVAKRVNP